MPVACANATRTMCAAVLTAARAVALERRPVPEPGPGQVRVRIQGCGVCGSDLPVWEGRDWFDYPREPGAPGHEGWGVVDAVGEQVHDVAPGTRVASLGMHAYAEYDVVDAGAVVPLPARLDGVAFPGEALGCAVNVFRRSAIEPGQTVGVVGAGFLGSLVIQLAVRAGARVVAVSRRPSALRVAQAMGAEFVIALDDEPLARVEALTGGALCDRVIEAAGKQETLDLAGQLVRVRGRLVIAGFHQDGRRSVDMQTWNWRGLDVINAHERDPAVYAAGVAAAARLVAAGKLDAEPLYSHRFPLDQLDAAFRTAVARPDGFTKALVLA
jgi:2-desacetyl-2-hydroxyethyl bacteriochlorophyllide A dehydrogenase